MLCCTEDHENLLFLLNLLFSTEAEIFSPYMWKVLDFGSSGVKMSLLLCIFLMENQYLL